MDSIQAQTEEHILLPERSLLVLCGPAGSGKSTFAGTVIQQQRHLGYQPTAIVSSDACRAMVCDDVNNQQVNRDTFDLFHYILHKRLFQKRFTIADSTALQPEARHRLLEIAQRHHYYTCIVLFNMSLQTCMTYDQQISRGRVVGESVIRHHLSLLSKALHTIPQEGWQQVHILDEQCPSKAVLLEPYHLTKPSHSS